MPVTSLDDFKAQFSATHARHSDRLDAAQTLPEYRRAGEALRADQARLIVDAVHANLDIRAVFDFLTSFGHQSFSETLPDFRLEVGAVESAEPPRTLEDFRSRFDEAVDTYVARTEAISGVYKADIEDLFRQAEDTGLAANPATGAVAMACLERLREKLTALDDGGPGYGAA